VHRLNISHALLLNYETHKLNVSHALFFTF
jgi:hypothetical protein